MSKRKSKLLSPEEAERLFSTLDETGHSNEDTARRQRKRRREKGAAIDIDPLSEDDPSGSTVGRTIARTAIAFVVVVLFSVVVLQVGYGVLRRNATADLSKDANIYTVTSVLRSGIEWGSGFTQFPERFTVQEADESTGRIEVSVTDTTAASAMELFAGSQVQATAFGVNALLNPKVDVVIYHVNVHQDAAGKIQKSELFGFLQPTGDVKTFLTYIWTKSATDDGVDFSCAITGLDDESAQQIRDKVGVSLADTLIGFATGSSKDAVPATTSAAATAAAPADTAQTPAASE